MPLGLRRYTEGLLGLLQTQDLPEAMEPKLRVTHPLGVRNSKHKQRSGRGYEVVSWGVSSGSLAQFKWPCP